MIKRNTPPMAKTKNRTRPRTTETGLAYGLFNRKIGKLMAALSDAAAAAMIAGVRRNSMRFLQSLNW